MARFYCAIRIKYPNILVTSITFCTFALTFQTINGFTMNQPFDKTDKKSIFLYSQGLLGHTLREFADESEIVQLSGKDKGKLGKLVEYLYFKYPPNSNPDADFSEAGMELKCTGLLRGTKENLRIKERMVCNMINYCEVVNETFEESHFYHKCLVMLFLFYLYQKGVNALDFHFLFSVLWKLPEKDLLIIKNDYETIITKIRNGEAHLLSEGDTVYLGACRKGQKGDALRTQPCSDIKAKGRAFSLKPAYMRTVLEFVLDSGKNAACNIEEIDFGEQLVSLNELRKSSFEDILLSRFDGFYGMGCYEIFQMMNAKAKYGKDKYFDCSNDIAGKGLVSNVNLSEEFKKSGITLKTVRVERNGTIEQSMSFENIDYKEVYECDNWEDSRLYEIFSNRFMFVVYRNSGTLIENETYLDWLARKNQARAAEGKMPLKHEDNYVLESVFFWTMPQKDLELARLYWEDIKEQIKADNIKNGAFWKLKDKKKFHVRPKGQLSKFKAVSPVTGVQNADKLCYWFNGDYVKEIVNEYSVQNQNLK